MPQTNKDIIQVSESKGRDQLLSAGRDGTASDSVVRRYPQYLRKLEEIKREKWRRGEGHEEKRGMTVLAQRKEERGKESLTSLKV